MLTADGSTGSRFSSPVVSVKATRYLVLMTGFEPALDGFSYYSMSP